MQSGLRGAEFDSRKPDARLCILLLVNLDDVEELSPEKRKRLDPQEVSKAITNALRSRKKMEPLAATLSCLKGENKELADYVRAMFDACKRKSGLTKSYEGASNGESARA